MTNRYLPRTRLLFSVLLTMFACLTSAAQDASNDEYADSYVTVGQAGPLQGDVPLNTAAGYSKMETVYYELPLSEGDRIRGITFSGCNTGVPQQRHLTVWMEDTSYGLPTSGFTSFQYMKKVADGLFTVKSGGTEASPERILEIPFDTTLVYRRNMRLRLTIVCEDGTPGSAVYFVKALDLWDDTAVCASGSDASAFDHPSRVGRPLLTLMATRPVYYVSGTVSNEEGHGIAGATVTLRSASSPFGPAVEGTTDGDGHYRIRIEDGSQQYFAVVTAPGRVILDDYDMFTATGNPVKDYTLYGSVTYPVGKRSTLTLPFDPDPTVGCYYTLDRLEGTKVVFRRVLEPQANQPYVLFADRDYHVSLEGYDLTTVTPGQVNIGYSTLSFIGTYHVAGYSYDDAFVTSMTPVTLDESITPGIGLAAHALFMMNWELGKEYELAFDETAIDTQVYAPMQAGGRTSQQTVLVDLQGRRLSGHPARGLYIRDGKKVLFTK